MLFLLLGIIAEVQARIYYEARGRPPDTGLDRLAAARRFLLFEYLPRTGSGWVGIERLEPGTILT